MSSQNSYKISKGRLILRIVKGLVVFTVMYFLLSYLPAHVFEVVGMVAPQRLPDFLVETLSSLIHPLLPMLGLVIAILLFLGVLYNKTKAYGMILIGAGLISAAYVYLAFHGGMIKLMFSQFTGMAISASFDLTVIMILAMIPAILMALKGLLLTFE